MKMRRKMLIALAEAVALSCTLVLPGAVPVHAAAAQQTEAAREAVAGREILNFNSDWGFFRGDLEGAEAIDFDDSAFANVTVPHTMRLEKKHCDGGAAIYKGIGWYRKYFTLGEEYAGKQLNIDFEGVQMDSDVYLNGEKIYTRNGGYVGFSVDITDKVKIGETNVLAVRVSSNDNPDTPPGRPDSTLDFHYYGGIYRDVTLRVTDKVHISDALQAEQTAGGGVFVTYPEVSETQAKVHVNTHVVNDGDSAAEISVKQVLKDADGQTAAEARSAPASMAAGEGSQTELDLTVAQPKLWHPDHPDLYTLETTVYQEDTAVDTVSTRIGIRTIEYKSDGFYINGERLYLRGANRHQAFLNVGDAASNSMQYRDALLFKQGGFNAVRAAHYPQDPAFLEACDELGLVVVECQPGWQNFTNSQTFYDRTIRDTREMIRRDRNHPSVILWESSLNETWCSEAWANEAVAAAHEEYPGDQFFTASDYGFYGAKYDVCYKVQDTQWSSDPSKWVDYDPSKPFFTREWGDFEDSSKALRKEGTARQNTQILTRQNYLNGNGYSDWGGLDASDRIGGYFLWSFNDYSRGSNSKTLGSGVVDIDRYEKNCFYWLKSMQSADNPAYGPMVFISSDYTADSSKDIMVFSNCDSVKLYQDDALVGEITREKALKNVPNIAKKGGSPIFTFTLDEIKQGSLRAEAILDGKVAATHEVKTPGTAAHLEIEVKDRGVTPVADGSDLIPVYVKAVDENGTVVPDYDGQVHISVSGEGELVGKDIPRIKAEDQVLESGIGSVFVRTSENAGDITITASAEGMDNGTAKVTTDTYTGTFVPDGSHTPWEGGVEKLEEEQLENLAAGKPVSFSSQQRGNEGVNGVDDDESTRWCANGGSFPQWFMVDLGKRYALSGFQILWEKGNVVCNYTIEMSDDGENWTTAVDLSNNTKVNGSVDTQMAKAEGRYVKLNITGLSDGWASFYELRVFQNTEADDVNPGEVIPDEKVEEITATGGAVDGRGTDKLRDGEIGIGTGWLSASKEFPQSVTIEFTEPQDLLGSRIHWEKDSSWYTYDLEVSQDGADWTKVFDQKTVSGQYYRADSFATVLKKVCFVRITITNIVAGGDFNIGMAEWILYGSSYVKEQAKEFEYASDLTWKSATTDYGSVTKDAGVYGGSLVLNTENGKVTYEKGLSADTDSEIVYDVSGKGYTRFESYIGINANAGKQGGEAIFKVYKDEELIYTSPVKMRNDNCEFISLDIAGAKEIRLEATWNDNPDNPEARFNTHVDWADAKFYLPSIVAVEGVSLDKEALTLKEGETEQLVATVLPENAENKRVIWSSSDDAIATVDETGLVTAKAAGTATIRVFTEDGSYKAKCAVTVETAEVPGVTREDLEKAIADAKAIELKGYTEESVQAFQEALQKAEEVLADESSVQEAWEAAMADLAAAVRGLVPSDEYQAAVKAAEAAAKAAQQAQAAAEEAQKKAETAQSDAEAAAKRADEAQAKASAARKAAEEAASRADADKAIVEQAKKDAQTAADSAEKAKQEAETAKNAAETAKNSAVTAQTKAEAAKNAAEAAAEAANDSKLDAQEAQRLAEAAQKAAETANKEAAEARDTAADAQKAAESASEAAKAFADLAEASRKAAEAAQEVAEAAQKAAEKARDEAAALLKKAQEEADAKLAQAEKALQDAQKMQQQLEELIQKEQFKAQKPVIAKAKSAKKKTAKITWKQVEGADGYVVEYALKVGFKGAKSVTVKKGSAISATLKKLKSKKSYYVRIKAYKTVGGEKVYTSYSAKKKVRIK